MVINFFNKKMAQKPFIPYAMSKKQGIEFLVIEKSMINGHNQEGLLNYWSPQDASILAAKTVGPRVYTLQLEQKSELIKILIQGCQGSGNNNQKNTAYFLNDIATKEEPTLVLMLGDHLYNYGATSPSDPGFNERFHYLYYSNMRAFMILGNHDGNYHSEAPLNRSITNPFASHPQGEAVEINEVAHTYLFHKSHDIEKSLTIFQQETLSLDDLSQWNMPYFFYSLIIGNVQLFCIDSNSYAKAFLDLKTKKNLEGKINQAAWIEYEYHQAKSAGRKIIFVQHHPLYTCGKRKILKPDTRHYLYQKEIDELNYILGSKTESYNLLLTLIYQAQGMMPDLVLAAHDHFISYYNNNEDKNALYKIRQGTFGGGGGKLQSRESFTEHPYVGCHFEKYGCGMLTFSNKNPESLILDFFTLKDTLSIKNYFHLKFSDQNHLPIHNQYNGHTLYFFKYDEDLEKFRHQVLLACDHFFEFLSKEEFQKMNEPKPQVVQSKPKRWYGLFPDMTTYVADIAAYVVDMATAVVSYRSPWTNEEAEIIKCVQEIINYFNQFELPNKETVKNDLFIRLAETWPKESWPKQSVHAKYADLCQSLLGGEMIYHLMDNEASDQVKIVSFA